MLKSEISGAGHLKIQYGDAAMLVADNDDSGFTESQVRQIRQLLQPYMTHGLLKNFGFMDASQKALGVQYASCEFNAVELRKKTSCCTKPYEILIYGHCGRYDTVHRDFADIKGALSGFLEAVYPGKGPRFSLV